MTRFDRTSKHPVIPKRVREAWQLLQQPGMTLPLVAQAFKMKTFHLREQFNRPHVRAWLVAQRRAELEALCAGNVAALRDVRDNGENAMARVAAVRQAEIMKADLENPVRGGLMMGQQVAPGMVVVIESREAATVRMIGGAQSSPLQIDAEPEVEDERVPEPLPEARSPSRW